MYRTLFQLYLNHCDEAIALYQKAFGATLNCCHRDPQNKILHAELDVFGQIVSFSENGEKAVPGNTMQLCLHFGKPEHEETVKKAYAVLKEEALHIFCPPLPCEWSSCMAGLIDKFGVSWCLFV